MSTGRGLLSPESFNPKPIASLADLCMIEIISDNEVYSEARRFITEASDALSDGQAATVIPAEIEGELATMRVAFLECARDNLHY